MTLSNLRPLLWLIFFAVLSSCEKESDDGPPPAPEPTIRLKKIIDWEAATFDKDTVPEYTVTYTDNRITQLLGIYQDTLHFKYEQNNGTGSVSNYPSSSRIIRTGRFSPYRDPSQDTTDFKSDSFTVVQGFVLGELAEFGKIKQYLHVTEPDGATLRTFYGTSYSGELTCNITASYNADGDLVSLNYKPTYPQTAFEYQLAVTYTNTKNTLKDIDANMGLYDPSFRNVETYLIGAMDPHANTFPFSIHYGSKCVSTYRITYYQLFAGGQRQLLSDITSSVSYEFNGSGNVQRVLINNQPFKEFLYAD